MHTLNSTKSSSIFSDITTNMLHAVKRKLNGRKRYVEISFRISSNSISMDGIWLSQEIIFCTLICSYEQIILDVFKAWISTIKHRKGLCKLHEYMLVFFVNAKRESKIDTSMFGNFFLLQVFLFYLADVISILLSKMDSIFTPRFILWHQNAEEKVWICIFEMKEYIFRNARRGGGTSALKVNYIFSAKCWTNNLHYLVKQELFQKKITFV